MMQSNESKIYVKVTLTMDADGNMTPLSIHWEDGTEYTVDKVYECVKRASLRAGGYGLRYHVRLSCDDKGIYGKNRFLFYETGLTPNRWFVEGKAAQQINVYGADGMEIPQDDPDDLREYK